MVEKLVVDWEEDVERPLSRVSETCVDVCSSSWACSGNVAAECSGLGESFRRLKLGWRGLEKFSAGGSGVCLPSDECDRYPLFKARSLEASDGLLCRSCCGSGEVKDRGCSLRA